MSFQDKLYPAPTNSFLKQEDLDKRPILDVRNLGIDFGGLTAVDGFNITIGPTEISGLIGPNGAGKTTVIKSVAGLVIPNSGKIEIFGEVINKKMKVL